MKIGNSPQAISSISIVLICLLSIGSLISQNLDSARVKHSFFPVAFYLPETGLALGATGILTWRFKDEPIDSRPSQIVYSGAYTLKNQLLLYIPFELYRKNETTRIKGELGYYKYFYNFFGLGPKSIKANRESYNVLFPRIDISYSKAISKNSYLGLGLKFDHFNITKIEAEGLLDTDQPIGYNGGTKANLFFLFFHDTRNHLFVPSKGSYFEALIQRSDKLFLSDFEYFKIQVDFKYFFSIYKKWILASQLYIASADQSTPFFDLPYVSSTRLGRGFDDRRFMNYKLLTAQSELRYPIKGRFSGVTFLTSTLLPESWSNLFIYIPKWSYGLGLRFELDRTEKTSFRFDVARGDGSTNFYITVNEAF